MADQRNYRARIVRKAIESVEAKLKTGERKLTLAELVRLLQIEKELGDAERHEVTVTWIESATDPRLPGD
jgi:hypothetical protein